MSATPAPNHRASLLAGLRTGGVRSSSASLPHSAAPGATFNIHRPSFHQLGTPVIEEDEAQYVDLPSQHGGYPNGGRAMPMTAAVDGTNFSHFMGQRGMNLNNVPFSPLLTQHTQARSSAFQLQMLQLEMMKIQAAQAQQLQAEMIAQAQRQQQQAQSPLPSRRVSLGYNPPATAGPLNNSFDLRSAALSAQMRRANQADQLKAQSGADGGDQVPMTAALGGKFGSRVLSSSATLPMARAVSTESNDSVPPSTPGATTVISGGTPLGTPTMSTARVSSTTSKSDTVSTWRRGGNNNSVLSGKLRPASGPSVTVTPPPAESVITPSASFSNKSRPVPLRFSGATTQPLPAVAIDTSEDNDETSSSSSTSDSSPTTPGSPSSSGTSLSPREEASKKLYEGLGIGRPASTTSINQFEAPVISVTSYRMASQPTRQPRGPPSGAEELGPKNFATRIRRQAIDGLGLLMGARERREFVEAF